MAVRELLTDQSYKSLFESARIERWSVNRLTSILTERLASAIEVDRQELTEAARYIADEFVNLGSDVIVVTDKSTGKQLATFGEEAIWLPPMTTRESGNIVQPLPRLHPEIESKLIADIHKQEHENDIMLEKSTSLVQTQLQKDESDSRLAIYTKEGRKSLIDWLRQRIVGERSIYAMLRHIFGGTLAIGPLADVEGQDVEIELEGKIKIEDLKSINSNFDFCAAMERSLAVSMVHQIVRNMTKRASSTSTVLVRELEPIKPKIWIVPDTQYTAIKPHLGSSPVVIVNTPSVLAVSDVALSLIPHELGESLLSFELEHFVLFKYRVVCSMFWKPENILRFDVQDVVNLGTSEVLS